MRRPLNTVWKIPKHLTSHTRAYAYSSNILFNLCNLFVLGFDLLYHYDKVVMMLNPMSNAMPLITAVRPFDALRHRKAVTESAVRGESPRRRSGVNGELANSPHSSPMAAAGAGAGSLRAQAAVERVGAPGSGGVTARELVAVLDLMGVVSNESRAAGLMQQIGYAASNGGATVYPTRALDELSGHLGASLPGRAAYRASAGPAVVPSPAAAAAAARAQEHGRSNDYRRQGAAAPGSNDYRRQAATVPAAGPPQPAAAGMSVAARLKAEFDQHKLHLQDGIEKRKSPDYLKERARLAGVILFPHFVTFLSRHLWCFVDLERKAALIAGYEISERRTASSRTRMIRTVLMVVVAVGLAVLARRRGVIGMLRERVRQRLAAQA